MRIKTNTLSCHRCGKLPTTFIHGGEAYLVGDRECPTCRRVVERFDDPGIAISRWNHTVTRKTFAGATIPNREVPTEVFNAILKDRITLHRSPCGCDGGGTVRILMPVYGMVGLYIECPYCKASTRVYSPVEAIFDEDSTRSATPYTFEAITQALRLAVEEWNQIGESRKGETNA